MALRAIPNLTLIRPADANEAAEAWRAALNNEDGPTALALSRQGLPTLDRNVYASADGLQRGAYVLRGEDASDIILIGTGSEVHIALAAAETLEKDGVQARVVSMPSWELFEKQPKSYRDIVLPPSISRRVSIEAGVTFGWERYVGLDGAKIGLDRFGESAPAEILYEQFGFTATNVVDTARKLLA